MAGAGANAWLAAAIPFARKIAFAPPDEGGGAAAEGGAAAGGEAAGAAGSDAGGNQSQGSSGGPSPGADDGQSSSAASAGAAYRPDGLPDHLFGKTDQETIDKLHKAVSGFRQVEGERGAVPKSADEYKFEASDKLKPYVADFDKDPVYKDVRGIAHKAGLTDKQFNAFLPAVLEHFVDAGLVEGSVNAEAELLKLAPAQLEGAPVAERKAAAERQLRDNIAWVDEVKDTGLMPPDLADAIAAEVTDKLWANQLVQWLRGQYQEQRPALDAGKGAGGMSDAQLQERLNDDRNNPSSQKFDKNFAAETDALYKKRYG